MTAEEWRPIPGFPGYEVSSLGRVQSHRGRSPRVLRTWATNGYLRVGLRDGAGQRYHAKIHVLVSEAFLGPRPSDSVVRHLDDVKTNNTISNLAYGSLSDNARDAVRNGVHAQTAKTECPAGHRYDEANVRVSNGRRHCRACDNSHRGRTRSDGSRAA